jgi:hypothetical protein
LFSSFVVFVSICSSAARAPSSCAQQAGRLTRSGAVCPRSGMPLGTPGHDMTSGHTYCITGSGVIILAGWLALDYDRVCVEKRDGATYSKCVRRQAWFGHDLIFGVLHECRLSGDCYGGEFHDSEGVTRWTVRRG